MLKGINMPKLSTPGLISLLAGICAITGGLSFVSQMQANQSYTKAMDTLVTRQTPNDQGGKQFKLALYDVVQASSIALTQKPGTPEYNAAVERAAFKSRKFLNAATEISVLSGASKAERGALTGLLGGARDIERLLSQSLLLYQQGNEKAALQTFFKAWNTLESKNGPIETAQAFSEEARERGAAEIDNHLATGKKYLIASIVLTILMMGSLVGTLVLISKRQKTGVSAWLTLALILSLLNSIQWTLDYHTVEATIETKVPSLVQQMQRATEYGSLVSAFGAGTAVKQLAPVDGSARITVKVPKLADFSSSAGSYSDQLHCLGNAFMNRQPGSENCQLKGGLMASLVPGNRKSLPGEWEYLAGAMNAVANYLKASPEDQDKAYGVLLSSRQILANMYQSEFDKQIEIAREPLNSADPLGAAAGTRYALVTLLILIGFVRELARYS